MIVASMGFKLYKLAPVATAYISAKHRSVPVVGKSFLGNKRDGINALERAAERVELVHHEELRLFTFEHLAAACRRSKFHLGRVVAEK